MDILIFAPRLRMRFNHQNDRTMNEVNEKLKKACQEALAAFRKLGREEYADISSKLEYVIGSYEHDLNPVGLHEFGGPALEMLRKLKEREPRKVNRKVIVGLEKAMSAYQIS
ncbi:MAG: hypothetical protein JW861_09285 [Bacteroidales bacterium]|nr:hypothetical protein [Bacteroidales bacterium]